MADPRFFTKSDEYALAALAECAGAVPDRESDIVIRDLAPLDVAGAGNISFLDNIRYKDDFAKTKAAACFVTDDMAKFAPEGTVCLITPVPYKAYALAAQAMYPEYRPEAEISEAAHIYDSVQTGDGCVIEPGVVVHEGAKIGEHCWIEANAVIGRNVKLGNGCRVGANASVSHALLGDNVRLYPGVRVGQDGFGFAIDPAGFVKVPQLGRVIIEDSVEIGANTTIDRGSGPDTVIGQGTWIDNLVQIAHNVRIGKGCVIVSQVGISGSTVLEDYVVLGGQVGIAGHLRIGTGARIAAQSGIMRDVPPGEEQMGSPAMPIKQRMRQIAMLNRMVKDGSKKGTE